MPKLTLDLSDATLAGLQLEVDRYNATARTHLTLAEWLLLHLKEVVVAPSLSRAITLLRDEHQADAETRLTSAINATRQALVDAL